MTEEYSLSARQISLEGLDLAGYRGKFEVAREMARKNERKDDYRLLPYWERVRVLFLELGGGYRKERK